MKRSNILKLIKLKIENTRSRWDVSRVLKRLTRGKIHKLINKTEAKGAVHKDKMANIEVDNSINHKINHPPPSNLSNVVIDSSRSREFHI